MRDIDKIILHCSATREGDNSVNAKVIDRWHKARGWAGIGYHFVILINGKIELGRMIDKVGAHVKGMNKSSIGICYIGGVEKEKNKRGEWVPKDTRTAAQIATMLELLRLLKKIFPKATIHGHNEFSSKACPSFDVQREFSTL
jgi:N-acetylmuramoyl-L-alanine amidase